MYNPNTVELMAAWGIDLDAHLRTLALTHRSWAFEHDTEHNERLEFLGDSVLGFIAADWLYREAPGDSEGDMSKIKAASVSEKALAIVARNLNLGSYIRLGVGEERTGGRDKDSILSDTVEALIAATYLQYGMDTVRRVVECHLVPILEKSSHLGPALDWRTAFEEEARKIGVPDIEDLHYEITGEGPDHARIYTAVMYLGEKMWGTGTASSQKAAKLAACADAYQRLVG
ncbi:ribonuclease III [Chlamydia trachomatis]|nr:ribonuclease III [Chlamydia trachomatis]